MAPGRYNKKLFSRGMRYHIPSHSRMGHLFASTSDSSVADVREDKRDKGTRE